MYFGDDGLQVAFGYKFQVSHLCENCCGKRAIPATSDTTFNLGMIENSINT